MLVKFDTYFTEKLLSVNRLIQEENPPMAVIVTENGVSKVPFSKKNWIENENISEMTPEWLRLALLEGNIVTMSRGDYDDIPMEIQQYGEILTH